MRLPDNRYEQIKQMVVALFSQVGVDSIPVDPVAIARKLGIRIASYQSLGENGEKACLRISESGFKFLKENKDDTSTWHIYYNASNKLGHIRFTILHELGHIVLGHFQESEVAEAEANFFAKYAIAPPPLVHMIQPNDYMAIADAFVLTETCAFNSWNYYCRWLRVSKPTDYERKLKTIFSIVPRGGGPMRNALRIRKGA